MLLWEFAISLKIEKLEAETAESFVLSLPEIYRQHTVK